MFKQPVQKLMGQLTSANTFFPVLKQTQPAFEAAGYRLWAGEAVMIAKIMTQTLVLGTKNPQPGTRWINKLTTIVTREPALAQTSKIGDLVTEHLYTELVFDAALESFTLLKDATAEDFGSTAEMTEYADGVVEALSEPSGNIDLVHTYLPLVLGGIVINSKFTLPSESPEETRKLIERALQFREQERSDANAFIFEMASQVIQNHS